MADCCCMCLSVLRRRAAVSPRHLQLMLLIYLDLKVVTSVCWECEARLSRLSAFRLQVETAQRVLQQLPDPHSLPLKSLSRLTYNHKNTFDASIIDEENAPQNELLVEAAYVSTMKLENYEIEMNIDPPFDNNEDEIDEHKIYVKNESYDENNDVVDNDKTFGENVIINDVTIDNSYTSVKLSKAEVEEQRELQRQEKKYIIAPYKCERCITRKFSKEELKKHNKNLHNRNNEYECKICEQRFENKILLKSHLRFHYYIYQCNLCQYRTTNFYYIRLHYKTKHSTKYTCSICNAVEESFSALRRHMSDSHKEKRQCEVCGEQVKHRDYKNHMDYHKKAKSQCPICKKRYKRVSDHMKRVHVPAVVKEKKRVSSGPVPEENRYCIECDLSFTTKGGLMTHLRHSKKHAESEPMFECDHCGTRWQTKQKLRQHIQWRHLQHKRAVCRYLDCRQVFVSREQLRTHLTTVHSHDPPPRDKLCPHCGKGFYTKKILQNHILTHTGERPHRCPECDRGFTQPQCVAMHLAKAHGIVKNVETVFRAVEQRYPCPEAACDMAYARKQNLKWHLWKKHGYKRYDFTI